MKVKVFKTTNKPFSSKSKVISQFEQDINHWLENNPKINITNIKQSSWQVVFDVEKHFISVWYEEE
jgi:hypothetical protein